MIIARLILLLSLCSVIQSCTRPKADKPGTAVEPATIAIHVGFSDEAQDFLFSLPEHTDKYRLPALVAKLSSTRKPGKMIVLDIVADCKMTSQEVDQITATLSAHGFIVENIETARNSDY